MMGGVKSRSEFTLSRRRFCLGIAALAGSPVSMASAGDAQALDWVNAKVAIIFVGASWCAVCKEAAPMLALLAETRGLAVLVASADARPIAPFENFVPIGEHPIAAGVERYPTTFIFSSVTQGIVGAFEGFRSASVYVRTISTLVDQAEALA